MKKLFVVFVSFFLSFSVFANTIPQEKELFVFVYDFVQDSTMWTDAKITHLDMIENEFIVTGYCVNKNIIGYMRQDYSVVFNGNENEYSISIVDLRTSSCDKNGVIPKGSKATPNPQSTMNKMSDLLSKELETKYTNMANDEYEKLLNDAVTNPGMIKAISKTSTELYLKKFIEKYNIEGRKVNLTVSINEIKENKPDEHFEKTITNMGGTLPEVYNYSYELYVKYNASSLFDFGKEQNVPIFYYTNDDDMISKKSGQEIQIKGNITKISFYEGKFNRITIYDN